MRQSDGPMGKVASGEPLLNNIPVSEHDVQTLQQVLRAKVESIERRTTVDPLKRMWKTSIWCEEDDVEMTLSDSKTPLVYLLHYA